MFEKDERYTAPDIPGVAEVIAWFGYWPTFHDAEVLSIALNRSGVSQVAIHAWEITPEISASGHYILAKHAVVTFSLEGFPENEQGIVNTEVAHFNQQNVLSSARVNKRSGGHESVLEGIYGVHGRIACERMAVKLEPR